MLALDMQAFWASQLSTYSCDFAAQVGLQQARWACRRSNMLDLKVRPQAHTNNIQNWESSAALMEHPAGLICPHAGQRPTGKQDSSCNRGLRTRSDRPAPAAAAACEWLAFRLLRIVRASSKPLHMQHYSNATQV